MAELYASGKQPNDQTVAEMIEKLEARKNYIPSSDRVRRDYSYALLKEYRKYVKEQSTV